MAEYHLQQLNILRGFGDPEVVFEIDAVEIDYLIQRNELNEALEKVNSHIQKLKKAHGSGMLMSVLHRNFKANKT